ncbi:MAG: NUDIX hydrolase [Flavobacteriales bacterium]|jgi:8-oxo-dGTP pyrophosphatase MutT (NUDIX family)|nr:NUDIX domain-containing protein [Flavobacteriaceae bacterium]
MYKVFYNQKPLFFTTNLTNNSDETPLLFIKYASALVIVKALRNKNTKAVYLYHPKEEKLEKHFLKHFPVIEAAGGLVEHTDGRYLFIYRNDKWDLPKGKIEKNEVIIDAAIREVIEETGVGDLMATKPLNTTYHVFNTKGKFKLKKTYWFLMKSNYDGPLVPQEEENIQAAAWRSKTDFPLLMKNAYENIKILLEEIK